MTRLLKNRKHHRRIKRQGKSSIPILPAGQHQSLMLAALVFSSFFAFRMESSFMSRILLSEAPNHSDAPDPIVVVQPPDSKNSMHSAATSTAAGTTTISNGSGGGAIKAGHHYQQPAAEYAYAFLVGGAHPKDPGTYLGPFLSIAIAAKILQEKGSKADVIVLYQNKQKVDESQQKLPPPDHLRILFRLGIKLYLIPQIDAGQKDSFYRTQMDKFRILGMTQYRKIMYLDTDVMPVGNLDSVMELSDHNGPLMESVIVRGLNVPAHGAHFVLTPGPGKLHEMQTILDKRQAEAKTMKYPWFDEKTGWGHTFTKADPWKNVKKKGYLWNYYGAWADQGLLLYYTKYFRKNVSILVPHSENENWGPKELPTANPQYFDSDQLFNSTQMKCDQVETGVRRIDLPERCLVHFQATSKPWFWLGGGGIPTNFTSKGNSTTDGGGDSLLTPHEYWFGHLQQLEQKLGLGLDYGLVNLGKKPSYGYYPSWHHIPAIVFDLMTPLQPVSPDETWMAPPPPPVQHPASHHGSKNLGNAAVMTETTTSSSFWTKATQALNELLGNPPEPTASNQEELNESSRNNLAQSPEHPPSNAKGLFEPASPVISSILTEKLLQEELGWSESPPQWITDLCPKVVEHFEKFPSFKNFPIIDGIKMSVGTSYYFASAVCTLSVVKQLAASVGAVLHLYAGSHLAAVLHGQPIPWDDDIDAMVPFWAVRPILEKCGDGIQIHSTARLRCVEAANALKIYVDYFGVVREPHPARFKFEAPFIDVFSYNITNEGLIFEVSPTGGRQRLKYQPTKFFPSQPFYYGGIYVMGPRPEIALNRYSAHKCAMGEFNHHTMSHIGGVVRRLNTSNLDLDCKRLSGSFPFVYDDETIRNGVSVLSLASSNGSVFNVQTETSIAQRLEWSKQQPQAGQELTDNLPGLNEVEVDNTISSQLDCGMEGTLKVVEYNAGRGTFWLEAVNLLREADVVILNEMDIGMARSNQQHTTRLLAHMLGMNYAWGLEFLELTNGDAEETERTKWQQNFHGLHGNAVLARCKITDPVVFRDKVGLYFDNKKNWVNAGGFEKRLGGRMGLYARIKIPGNTMLVVGSTHKMGKHHAEEIIRYIGSDKAVSAGDHGADFCSSIGLNFVGNPTQRTWPGTCAKYGRVRGDNVCSNLVPSEDERANKPCLDHFGIPAQLSDHTMLINTFQLQK